MGGGRSNLAAGDFSFVAGRRASNGEAHNGVFLFADSTFADFGSAAANELAVRASGGFRFRTAGDLSTGCNLPAGSGTFSCTSDERTKRDLEAIDPRQVLRGLAGLPIPTWRFAGEDPKVRHMGPTAQDFHRAFGLGSDRTSIGLPDAIGVTMAAVQGLDAENRELSAELAELKEAVASLRAPDRRAPAHSSSAGSGRR